MFTLNSTIIVNPISGVDDCSDNRWKECECHRCGFPFLSLDGDTGVRYKSMTFCSMGCVKRYDVEHPDGLEVW